MPKQRITKDMVMTAAFQILREQGEEQVLVKNIATKLSCSVQPIYSYCENMDALRQELAEMAGVFMREYVSQKISKYALFESTGKAYIAFSKEEPNLFKSYFLRKRDDINNLEDLYATEASGDMAKHIAKTLGISEAAAKKLHMNMIIYNTGLSFMLICTGGNLSEEELSMQLDTAYHTFLNEIKTKEE